MATSCALSVSIGSDADDNDAIGVECRRIADIYVAAVKKFGKKTKREIENVVERDEIDGVVKRNALLGKRECDIPGF